MTTKEKLEVLLVFVSHSLQNCDGIGRPYNLGIIKKMLEAIVEEM